MTAFKWSAPWWPDEPEEFIDLEAGSDKVAFLTLGSRYPYRPTTQGLTAVQCRELAAQLLLVAIMIEEQP